MTTDFNYGKTTITSAGPFKPKNRNVPMNARYRVETYADIATIPVPAVGELIFVLSDENNDNKQNIYVIKSLKPSNLGVADSLVDEVVPLKTFLGTDDINLSDYVTEDELNNKGYATIAEVDQKITDAVTGGTVDLSGYALKTELPTKTSQLTNDSNYLTSVPSEYVTETELETELINKVDKVSGYSLVSDTEIARLANVDNYDDTELMNLIPDKTSDLENDSNFISSNDEIDATTLNGKTISGPMTKEEYEALADKDPNTIYLVDADSSIDGLPSYTVGDANKALTVNSTGTSVGWNDVNVDLDDYYTKSEVEERIASISTGGSVDLSSYATKNYVDTEIDNIDIPTKVSQLENDSNYLTSIPSEYITETEMNEAISNIVLDSGNITFRDIEENEIFTVIVLNDTPTVSYGSLIISSTTLTLNENGTTSFTVTLDKAPTNNQTVSLSLTDNNCNIDKSSITFTPDNYNIPQTITVNGKTDSSSYQNKTDTIIISSTNVPSMTISVTIVNTDVQKELTSISAVYNQGEAVIYPDTPLNDLKQGLTVVANYSDSTSSNVTDYSLNGTLTEGVSTITVSYQGQTTTFNVTVSALPVLESITAVYNQGGKVVYSGGRLDDLKNDLVVTASYSDGNDVIITDYELSGVLEIGTSTITVSYQDKTAVFDVTVSEKTTSDENKKYISLEKVNDTEYLVLQLEESDDGQHPEYLTLNEKSNYDTESYKFYMINFNLNMSASLTDYVDLSDSDILGLSEQTNFNTWRSDANEEESFMINNGLYVKINTSNLPENPSISDAFKYINNNILEHNALKIKSKVKTVLTVTDICSYIDESSNISSSADENNVFIKTSFAPFGENTSVGLRSILNNYGWYGKPVNATTSNTIGFCIASSSGNYNLFISLPKEHFVDNDLDLNYENCRHVFNTYYSDIELYSFAEKVTV